MISHCSIVCLLIVYSSTILYHCVPLTDLDLTDLTSRMHPHNGGSELTNFWLRWWETDPWDGHSSWWTNDAMTCGYEYVCHVYCVYIYNFRQVFFSLHYIELWSSRSILSCIQNWYKWINSAFVSIHCSLMDGWNVVYSQSLDWLAGSHHTLPSYLFTSNKWPAGIHKLHRHWPSPVLWDDFG